MVPESHLPLNSWTESPFLRVLKSTGKDYRIPFWASKDFGLLWLFQRSFKCVPDLQEFKFRAQKLQCWDEPSLSLWYVLLLVNFTARTYIPHRFLISSHKVDLCHRVRAPPQFPTEFSLIALQTPPQLYQTACYLVRSLPSKVWHNWGQILTYF